MVLLVFGLWFSGIALGWGGSAFLIGREVSRREASACLALSVVALAMIVAS